jgi:predicted Ser/Thr protein kinase
MTVAQIMVAGRYRLHHALGAGGMGRVWLARDEVLRRDVAIKQVALPFALSDEEREELRLRTMREARAAARLSHPNVVKIYDVVRSEEQPWIVMEYVPSRSLYQVVNEYGPLGVREVAAIGLAVLSALDAAHASNVLHRDVKPSNVLIAEDGRIVLTDFGLATMDEGEGAVTQTGLILGSPQYIAPERAQTGISTREADLWSLGATLYAAVEGRAPYSRPTALGTLVALATERPDPMHRAGDLKPVLAGLLRREPRSRMTVGEARWQLAQAARGETVARVPRPRRGQRTMLSGVAGTELLIDTDEITPRLAALARQATPSTEPATGILTAAGRAAAGRALANGSTVGTETGPARGRERRGAWRWVAGGTAAAALAVAAAIALDANPPHSPAPTSARKGNGTAALATQPPNQAALADPSTPGPSVSPAQPEALPGGWKWYNHAAGFRVPVPADWTTVQADDTYTLFCAPDGPPILQVGLWKASDPVPVTALQRDESEAKLPGYHRIRIDALPQGSGAEWEYTFQDPKMGALRGLDRVFVEAGQPYLVQWRTSPNNWQAALSQLQLINSHFHPVRRPAVNPT